MHPDLLNNSLFLRYYTQWQKNPDSVVFASIAEFFIHYGLIDDALKVCREGLRRHPNLISGRIVMAKVHLKRGNYEEAEEELRRVLRLAPHNQDAQDLILRIQAEKSALHSETPPLSVELDKPRSVSSEWQTVTMAKIYAAQGHKEEAERIFHSILEREPENEDARKGLASINS